MTEHGWGRTVQGIGAALTRIRCDTGGFVINKTLDNFLRINGLTDRPELLKRFGDQYPANLQDQALIRRAVDSANKIDCIHTAQMRGADGSFPYLIGFEAEDTGLASYTVLAFALFGVGVPSLTYLYVLLIGFGFCFFALSHSGDRAAMVAATLLTLAIYLTASSTLVSFYTPREFGLAPGPGIDLKDPRFLGTIAAFPLLHILVGWFKANQFWTRRDYAALIAQSILLSLALHVRSATVWILMALFGLWVLLLIRGVLKGRTQIRSFMRCSSPRSVLVISLACVIPIMAQLVIHSSYHQIYGRGGGIGRHSVWDGILQSLQYNPDWSRKYGSLASGATGDQLSNIVARKQVAELPHDRQSEYLDRNGNPSWIAYENISKDVFLGLVRSDPGFVLYTFFVIKPVLIFQNMEVFYRSVVAGLSGWRLVFAGTTLLLLGWIASSLDFRGISSLARIGVAVGFSFVFSVLPNWLVLVNRLVMFDSFLWSGWCACLVLMGLSAVLARLIRTRLGVGVELRSELADPGPALALVSGRDHADVDLGICPVRKIFGWCAVSAYLGAAVPTAIFEASHRIHCVEFGGCASSIAKILIWSAMWPAAWLRYVNLG